MSISLVSSTLEDDRGLGSQGRGLEFHALAKCAAAPSNRSSARSSGLHFTHCCCRHMRVDPAVYARRGLKDQRRGLLHDDNLDCLRRYRDLRHASVLGFAAHADYFTSWVATTCDPHSGRAIVRFGYADADDPPLFFVQAEPSFDGGMSAIPATNASKEEASCKLSNKREVKIRRSEGDEFSIWVDGIRIAHDQIDIDKLPFEFIIDREGFRRCTFQILSGRHLRCYVCSPEA